MKNTDLDQSDKKYHYLIRYDEIGLKGGNRGLFEKILVKNIKDKINKNSPTNCEMQRNRGRVYLMSDIEASQYLRETPGIHSFSEFFKLPKDELFIDNFSELIKEKISSWGFGDKPFTFKAEARRADKDFPLGSQ